MEKWFGHHHVHPLKKLVGDGVPHALAVLGGQNSLENSGKIIMTNLLGIY